MVQFRLTEFTTDTQHKMAKLPTFEAKRATGGGGIVQMTPQERSMRKSFRKSANMKASDIYQSAGTMALAGAVENMGKLANKIAVQRDQANLTEEVRKFNEAVVGLKMDISDNPEGSIERTMENLGKLKDALGGNLSKDSKLKLDAKIDYSAASLNFEAMKAQQAHSREKAIANINSGLAGILSAEMTVEDKLSAAAELVMPAVESGILSQKSAQKILNEFNGSAIDEDFYSKLNDLTSPEEAESIRDLIEFYPASSKKKSEYKTKVGEQVAKVIQRNKEKYAKSWEHIQEQVDKGLYHLSDYMVSQTTNLFGEKEAMELFSESKKTGDDIALFREFYDNLANAASKITDEDELSLFLAKAKAKFDRDNPQESEISSRAVSAVKTLQSSWIKSNAEEISRFNNIKDFSKSVAGGRLADVGEYNISGDVLYGLGEMLGGEQWEQAQSSVENFILEGGEVTEGDLNAMRGHYNDSISMLSSTTHKDSQYLTETLRRGILERIRETTSDPKQMRDVVERLKAVTGDKFNQVTHELYVAARGDKYNSEGTVAKIRLALSVALTGSYKSLDWFNRGHGEWGSLSDTDKKAAIAKVHEANSFKNWTKGSGIEREENAEMFAKIILGSDGGADVDTLVRTHLGEQSIVVHDGWGNTYGNIPTMIDDVRVDADKVQESVQYIVDNLFKFVEPMKFVRYLGKKGTNLGEAYTAASDELKPKIIRQMQSAFDESDVEIDHDQKNIIFRMRSTSEWNYGNEELFRIPISVLSQGVPSERRRVSRLGGMADVFLEDKFKEKIKDYVYRP